MRLDLNRLNSEPPYREDTALSWYEMLDILSHGSHIYGQVYVPGGEYSAPHPCVCLFHGFPGTMNNDDFAVALQRMGCVVVRPFHRGAWGSEGCYTVTHCIEDAVATAEWAVTEEAAEKYGIDPKRVFLAGQSMGGNTALNAARRLPWALGAIMMAPFNVARCFKNGQEEWFRDFLREEGYIIRQESPDAIFEDAAATYRDLDFETADDDLRDRNVYFTCGTLDDVAPAEQMIMPLWNELAAHETAAKRKLVFYETNHGFCNRRLQLAHDVAAWINEVCEMV